MKHSLKLSSKTVLEVCSLLLILACAFWVRFWWMSSRSFGIFNSDQAVIGLMAKHILEGKPMVYFYGQGYMGSLEAFTAAFIFHLRGMTLSSLQCAPLLFYFGFLAVNFCLLKKVFGLTVSFIANLLLAISPSSLSILSLTSLGGYPETLFFGSLVLYGWVCYEEKKSRTVLFLTGLAAGLGFWVNNLILMYFLAGGIFALLKSRFWKAHYSKKGLLDFFFFRMDRAPSFLRWLALAFHCWVLGFVLWHLLSFFLGPQEFTMFGQTFKTASPVFHVKKVKFILEAFFAEGVLAAVLYWGVKDCLKFLKPALPFFAGFLIGGSPVFIYALLGGEGYRVIHGAGMVYFKDLPVQFDQVILDGVMESILSIPRAALFHGAFPTALHAWGTLILSVFFMAALPQRTKEEGLSLLRLKPADYSYAAYPLIMLAVNLLICLFCNLKSCRYLMPLYFSMSLLFALAAEHLHKTHKKAAVFLLSGLIVCYVFSNYISIQQTPDRTALHEDYKKVLGVMQEKNIRGGFADYWLSYEMTFLSQEKVVIAPYHSEDRYPAYTQFSQDLERAAYLFLKDRDEDDAFEKKLTNAGIPYERQDFGEIRLFIVEHRGAV